MSSEIGERFAQAVARKDRPGLLELLGSELDFRGMTPGRFWEATSAKALVDEVILGAWFESGDHVDSLVDMHTDTMADRHRVSYRLRVTNGDGAFLVEQQAYFGVENDRINWLRIMCSGFRTIDGGPTAI